MRCVPCAVGGIRLPQSVDPCGRRIPHTASNQPIRSNHQRYTLTGLKATLHRQQQRLMNIIVILQTAQRSSLADPQ